MFCVVVLEAQVMFTRQQMTYRWWR